MQVVDVVEVVDISIVVPVMNDEAGLLFTLDALSVAACFFKPAIVEVVVVDGNGESSGQLAAATNRWPCLRIISLEDPGGGPYVAVDHGLRMARGRIQSWLNAGDYIFPQAVQLVVNTFESIPGTQWLCGSACLMTKDGLIGRVDAKPVYYPKSYIAAGLYRKAALGYLQQEGMFWSRDLYLASGGLDHSLKLAADYSLWMKFAQRTNLTSIVTPIAAFEVSPGTQRSRVYETDYLREVKSCAHSGLLSYLFEKLSGIHYGLVVFARCWTFSHGRVILVDAESGKLVPCVGLWPVARVTLWNLVSSLRVRRQGNHD